MTPPSTPPSAEELIVQLRRLANPTLLEWSYQEVNAALGDAASALSDAVKRATEAEAERARQVDEWTALLAGATAIIKRHEAALASSETARRELEKALKAIGAEFSRNMTVSVQGRKALAIIESALSSPSTSGKNT